MILEAKMLFAKAALILINRVFLAVFFGYYQHIKKFGSGARLLYVVHLH